MNYICIMFACIGCRNYNYNVSIKTIIIYVRMHSRPTYMYKVAQECRHASVHVYILCMFVCMYM